MPGLNGANLDQLKEAFSRFDRNNDGKISENEFKNFFIEMGMETNDKDIKLLVIKISDIFYF